MCVCMFLTLREHVFGNTSDISAIIHFLYPKLDSFFNIEYYMYLLTGTRNSQALYRTKSNATVACKQNNPMLVSASSAISGIPAKEMSQLHNKLCGWDH